MPAPQWEYLHLSMHQLKERKDKIAGEDVGHLVQTETVLNALGAEGWELVSYSYPVRHMFVLKRPKL